MIKTKDNYFSNILETNDACLAPLAGVTDLPFRLICQENGAGFMVTEMVSAKGLMYENKATNELLMLGENEKDTGVQIFGSDADVMSEAVKRYLNNSDFAFIDINMGCPVKKIVSNGEGSALLSEPKKLYKVANAVVKASVKPVSAKIRIGIDQKNINCVETAKLLEDAGIRAITVHARTREQMYSGKADWEKIAEVVSAVQIPIIGNGDVNSVEAYLKMKQLTGCHGVMIGRGAMGNPFIFQEIRDYHLKGSYQKVDDITKLDTALRHFSYLLKYKNEYTACTQFRKHLSWYTKGMPHSAKLRGRINSVKTKEELFSLVESMKEELLNKKQD